ncbi:hypothetical protein F511_35401 [Dorcoceras hygrometricum]|uniref:Uncharacterized protein n=1 Tax=Dorcoceras hygrometricum TaxID=472368 RepID=A0A2Z7CMY8_9LAMI|nr:hypothetical protein F511_35401 [Dorcoceras hygrometricum]
MVKRKATEVVDMELQERTFGTNHVDACGMLTPTDAEFLYAHYISGDLVVSNVCAVTRRMSKLMIRVLKVMCSQRRLSPTPRSTSPRSPPHGSTPPRSTTPRNTPPRSPPPRRPPSRETTERPEKIPSTDSPNGFVEGAQVEGNQTEGSTKSIPETVEGAQVEGNQTEGSTKSIPETDRSVDSNGKILLDLATPLARMMPHILVAMGVQTDTDTQ